MIKTVVGEIHSLIFSRKKKGKRGRKKSADTPSMGMEGKKKKKKKATYLKSPGSTKLLEGQLRADDREALGSWPSISSHERMNGLLLRVQRKGGKKGGKTLSGLLSFRGKEEKKTLRTASTIPGLAPRGQCHIGGEEKKDLDPELIERLEEEGEKGKRPLRTDARGRINLGRKEGKKRRKGQVVSEGGVWKRKRRRRSLTALSGKERKEGGNLLPVRGGDKEEKKKGLPQQSSGLKGRLPQDELRGLRHTSMPRERKEKKRTRDRGCITRRGGKKKKVRYRLATYRGRGGGLVLPRPRAKGKKKKGGVLVECQGIRSSPEEGRKKK